jgi:hypothetical protein
VVDPLPESTSARAPEPRLTILQSKFAAYLSWSQPFIHHLVMGLDPYVRNIVACNRTENLDRFPVKEVIRFPDRYLFEPRLAVLAAAHVKSRFAPDVIHAHFGWSGLRMLLLKQFLRIPMVVTFGGRDIGAQMRLPYFDRLYQVLLSACEEIVCVSKDLRGKVIDAGVRRYMADADILLHCSITPESGDIEGIPNVVVEAEAMGLPVVATRHGGIVEAVLDGSTGLLVGERDVHALVEALACLIQDRSRRLDMGKAARAFVERDFNLESQVREHLAIYGEMKAQERAGLLRARTWIPANYPELVRLTIRNHEEFSVAELLERFIWARRMETRFHEPVQRESRLERLYDLKKYVPQMLKYPVKLMVGRTLATAIEARYRNGAAGEAQETLESLDERVLSFFRGGGEIASGSESWGRIEDMLKSYPQVEHLETESQERGTP